MKKLAVLVSGTGSLLEAMFKDALAIDLVMADRECRALTIAKDAQVPVVLLERKDFTKNFEPMRHEYTLEVVNTLKSYKIDIIAMSGYMTLFAPVMFKHYDERILNTHPSLLPAFKGDRAVRDALEYGVKWTGCTIHIATEELDHGRILAQAPVPVLQGDSVETLHERIKVVERTLYPKTIREFMQRK